MKDATEFRLRFADWKAGRKVYDAGKPIPKYDDGTDDKTYLPEYEYEATVTPQGASLEKHKRITNEEDWLKYWGNVGAGYVNLAQESVAKPVLEGLKDGLYLTQFSPLISAVETGVNLYNQDYLGAALSAAAGIPGAHVLYNKALPTIGKLAKPYTNYFASKALSNAIDESVGWGLLRSNAGKFVKTHPIIRTKIGDVEIDNPNLFYRQGGGTMGSEFLKRGVVDADGKYINPMFKRGGLWYGLEDAKEAYTVKGTPKRGKLDLLFKPRVSNGKPDLIVSTAEMSPANNKSRPLPEILTTLKNHIYSNVDFSRAEPWMRDFMKLWNDAYYLGAFNESPPVTRVTNELARSVPKTKDGATAANSTLFRYEPGYGFRKYPKDDFSKTSLDFLRAAIRANESKLLGKELPASFRTSVLSKKFSGGGEHFVSIDPNDANYVIKYSRLGLPKESLLNEIADTEILNKYSDIVEPLEYLGYTNEGDGFVRGYYRLRHIMPLDETRAIRYSNRPEEYDRVQEIAENAYDRIRANVPLLSSMFVHEPGTNIIIPEGAIGDYGKMHNIGFGSKGKPIIFDPMFHGNSLEATLYYRMRQLLGLTPLDKGKSIHINPANKGKFNATKKRTGKTTEQLAHSKNPLTRKRAVFALNSRKWSK